MKYDCGFAILPGNDHCWINGHCAVCRLEENSFHWALNTKTVSQARRNARKQDENYRKMKANNDPIQ